MNKKSNQKSKESTNTPPRYPSGSMVRPPDFKAVVLDILKGVLQFLKKFNHYGREFAGLLLGIFSILTLLGLFGLSQGIWLLSWAGFIRKWLGWGGSILLVLSLAIFSLIAFRVIKESISARDWLKIIAIEISSFSLLALLAVFGGSSIETANNWGGLIGWGLAESIAIILSPLPKLLIIILQVLIFSVIFLAGLFIGASLFQKLLRSFLGGFLTSKPRKMTPVSINPTVSIGSMGGSTDKNVDRSSKKRRLVIPDEHRKKFKVESETRDKVLSNLPRSDILPTLALLENGKIQKPDEQHINQTAGLIETTLAEFGIPAKVIDFQIGPTVTQFAVEPGYIQKPGTTDEENRQKVRVSQISALKKDLALALSAERLRIQAPVPGRSFLGIEVPNKRFSMVRLKPILETEDFYKVDSSLAIALGRDVSGNPVVADLSKMPHLLIAGTTGSGKSVCIAAITTCLAMNNTPDELRLVMIDPKMVELVRFNGLPHLIGKVETNLERIGGVLRWVVVEMQNRYKQLEELRARDIESYNQKANKKKEYQSLPRIVVLIDELADLMMNAAEMTESTIVRLAQMARAVGIHLIVATQRPSTDVVTGLIKANFPARLSFAVASGMDSRVILDGPGAETLLGRGDMLFLSPEGGMPMRAQGVMVSDTEIENMIKFWQSNWHQDESDDADSPWEQLMVEEAVLATKDDLVEQAIELIRETGRASASLFQRRLKIGYPRAARLVDELEDYGVVGPSRGGGREREILIDTDEDFEEGL